MNRNEITLIKKDIKEVTGSKQVFLPMIIVPVLMVVIIPAVFILIAHFGGDSAETYRDFEKILSRLPVDLSGYKPNQIILYLAMNLMFPSFFLLIPIMVSSISGASSFVGEREHKTMETLLYTPISMEQLMRAKLLGILVPSYIVALISFIGFGIVMNIGGMLEFGYLIFPNIKWIIIILWITPAIDLLALTFTVLVSAKSSTFQEAQQVSGLLVLPVIFILIGQMTGLFFVSNLVMIIGGAVIFIIDYVLVKRIAKGFNAERLI